MNLQPELEPALPLAGQGRVLRAFGDEITVLLSGDQTGGKYAMLLDVAPPGGGPPPHSHENEDELFYVLEGRASFLANGEWTEVLPGTAAFLPKGSIHTFKNVGDTPLKLMVTVSPAGFEKFFGKCADEFAKPGAPDMASIIGLAAKHGIHFAQP